MAVSRMRNEKYAIWPSVMAKSPKLLHSSAMDWETRLWGRYHVPQNVFLVRILIHKNVSGCTTCTLHCAAFYTSFRLSLTSIGLKLSFTTASISSASRFPRLLEINVHSMSTCMQKTSTWIKVISSVTFYQSVCVYFRNFGLALLILNPTGQMQPAAA